MTKVNERGIFSLLICSFLVAIGIQIDSLLLALIALLIPMFFYPIL